VRLVVTLWTILPLYLLTNFDKHHTCRFAKTNTNRRHKDFSYFLWSFPKIEEKTPPMCETWSQHTIAGQRTSYVGTTLKEGESQHLRRRYSHGGLLDMDLDDSFKLGSSAVNVSSVTLLGGALHLASLSPRWTQPVCWVQRLLHHSAVVCVEGGTLRELESLLQIQRRLRSCPVKQEYGSGKDFTQKVQQHRRKCCSWRARKQWTSRLLN